MDKYEEERADDNDRRRRGARAAGSVDWVQWWTLAKVALAFGLLLGLIAGLILAEIWIVKHLLDL